MATHSSILVWRIPWTEEPSSLQSTGSQSQTGLKHTHLVLHIHRVILVLICSTQFPFNMLS